MSNPIRIEEKFEWNGWPSMPRPDIKSPAGWSLELITSLKRIYNHALSPDGKQIAFFWEADDLADLYVLPHTGGWPVRLSIGRGPTLFWNDEVPQWSPDSSRLAFTSQGHVWVVGAAGGSLPENISSHLNGAWSPRWMPDGQQLIVSFEKEDADQFALINPATGLFKQLTFNKNADHWDARPSADGLKIAFALRPFDDFNRMDICLLDVESGEIKTLHGKPKIKAWGQKWSPDGKWLAFISQEGGHDDVWLIHSDGSGLKKISNEGFDISDLAWSPDSRQLACVLNRAGSGELGLLTVRSGSLDILGDEPGWHSRPQWSPGGAFLTVEFESPIDFPEIYKLQVATGQHEQLTFSASTVLTANEKCMPVEIRYPSADGLEIPAFLFRPKKSNGAAIVSVHGGPSSQYTLGWDELAQYLVAKGYTLLMPNYRGSTGYGVQFEHANYNRWGLEDTQDCLAAADYLKTIEEIDPQKIGIMGGSYGGYLTNCSLSRDAAYRFACGISKYGDGDVINSWALCSRELRYYTQIFLGHPAENKDVYLAGSPIFDVPNIQKPMLLLHGLKDDIVPPESSEQWAQALRQQNKTFEYKTYPLEPHGFVRRLQKLDAYSRICQFLDWYLLPSNSI